MRKVAVSFVLAFLVGCCFFSGISNPIEKGTTNKTGIISKDSLMNSPWPMYCHDIQHTGQSPYSTITNTGGIAWKVQVPGGIDSSPATGIDGTIYVGSNNYYGPLYAINPNGTEKWEFHTYDFITSSPAIAEDGTIYFGSWDKNFYAVNPNGTLRWKFYTQDTVRSSPAIAKDGTIYLGVLGPGAGRGRVYALYPNGTEKWHVDTGNWVYSSGALDKQGTIYFTSNDGNLYAINPNGTIKWMYGIGSAGSPAIGDDGTIYVSSNGGYLFAIYQNGTMKWNSPIGWGSGHVPSIANDGTIYIGGDELYAIYPNGTRKWAFNPGRFYDATSGSQAISADGTIYFGVSNDTGTGGYLIAVNPNGTEKWREWIHNDHVWSSPAIAVDGTVYIGASLVGIDFYGILYAIGPLSPNAPTAPEINGEINGKAGQTYEYTFTSLDPTGDTVYYYIEWGDGRLQDWIGPYASGESITVNHSWSDKGDYSIRARAKDTDNNWGTWGELEVTMPKNKAMLINHPILSWLFERFPNAFPILRYLLDQ